MITFALVLLLSGCQKPTPAAAPLHLAGPSPQQGPTQPYGGDKGGRADSLRITIRFKDGSNVTGIPSSLVLSIRTPYGVLALPFADLSSVAFLRNSDSVTVLFRNGDRLQGALNGPLCPMRTIVGVISPSGKDILSLTIFRNSGIDEEGLLAYYPFDGNADDLSGHNNNGVIHGAEPTEDRFGNPNSAFLFNGIDAYIAVPSSPTLHPVNQFSLAMWIRIDAQENLWSPVIHKGGVEGPEFYSNREYSFFARANGAAPGLYFFSAGNAHGQHEIHSAGHPMGGWHFIVVVADRRRHIMQLYADGAKTAQEKDSYSTFNANNDAMLIGSMQEGWKEWSHFHGALDELRIYGRALTAREISEMFVRR